MKVGQADHQQPVEPQKRNWKDVAKTIGVGVAGGAAGAATAYGLAKMHPFFTNRAPSVPAGKLPFSAEELGKIFKRRQMIAKITLPILGGASAMLADRYRKATDEGMLGTPNPERDLKKNR